MVKELRDLVTIEKSFQREEKTKLGLACFLILSYLVNCSCVFAQSKRLDIESPKHCNCCGDELAIPRDSVEEVSHCKTNPIVALQDELFIGAILITAWGVHFWDWFEHGFHFKDERGFRLSSSTGGADKLGHFWDTFVIADFLNWRLKQMGFSKTKSAIAGALSSLALMTWLEIGDGTGSYGFSWEDMLANFLGATVSFTLAVFPLLDNVLDFRVEYWPTSEYFGSGEFVADYSGMKFLLAAKLSGIKPIRRTPFRLIEIHVGFYSRGFRTFDINQKTTTRAIYYGLGFDIYELIRPILHEKIKQPIRTVFTYYQPPITSFEIGALEYKHTTE